MIPGRKLLLADDSIAIQKVIDLTFTDEGMEVTAVGDGKDALEKLNQFTPDVVLADVYMPGLDGYALCRFIKENERFRGVPVMLLVGSFEPFDEAEAKRAGADDVVTKPFQSIRDLVSRVGLLVRHERPAPDVTANQDGDEDTVEAETSAGPAAETSPDQANVRVFVEAPSMEPDATVLVEAPMMEMEPSQAPEHTCPPVIDLQTADTMQLEPVSESAVPPAETEFADTVELEFVGEGASYEAGPTGSTPAPPEMKPLVEVSKFDDDGVLDLGDIDSFTAAAGEDDFVLDVDVDSVNLSSEPAMAEPEAPVESVAAPVTSGASLEPAEHNVHEPAVAGFTGKPTEATAFTPSVQPKSGELSPDVIEAISRRVVEQMSDKVVREIAWEVVPELSELLIKKRLEDQR